MKLTKEELDAIQSRTPPDMDREARLLMLWLNSMGAEPPVTNIYEDLRDGIILCNVLDRMNPGSVDWKAVRTKKPMPIHLRVQNTNYVIKLCQFMKFSLVNIDGPDLESGNHKITLAVVWQMVRYFSSNQSRLERKPYLQMELFVEYCAQFLVVQDIAHLDSS